MMDLYKKLFLKFGNQNWWPADTPFEVAVGAILTQQTKWESVERAIANLKQAELLHPHALAAADQETIEEQIRCTGFYHQKSERLLIIAKYFTENNNDISKKPLKDLQRELLELKGVGRETADSILLYAADKPCFVIDAYTRQVCKCIGIEGSYQQLQQHFEQHIPTDVELYKNYHALIVVYAKEYCNKKRCDECIINSTGRIEGIDY